MVIRAVNFFCSSTVSTVDCSTGFVYGAYITMLMSVNTPNESRFNAVSPASPNINNRDIALDDFIRQEESFLQMFSNNKPMTNKEQQNNNIEQQNNDIKVGPKIVAIVSKKEASIRKISTQDDSKKQSKYALDYESDYAQKSKIDAVSTTNGSNTGRVVESKVRGLKKISKKSLIILKRYIDSDPLTLEQRMRRLEALSEPKKNPYEEFPIIKIVKNKQLEKDRAIPWKDANEVDYALPVAAQPPLSDPHTPRISPALHYMKATKSSAADPTGPPRPPSSSRRGRSYQHSRASLLRQINSEESKDPSDPPPRRSVSPPSRINPNVELLVESRPYNLQIPKPSAEDFTNVSPGGDVKENTKLNSRKGKKPGKIVAASTFVPVSARSEGGNRPVSPSTGLIFDGSKPLEWSKQFGETGRLTHLKRDLLTEKKRNRPPPASQSEHLLDLINKMIHRLCKKLAVTMVKSMKFADDHCLELSRDINPTIKMQNASAIANNSRSHSALPVRYVSYNPRATDQLMDQAVRTALDYSQGVLHLETKNISKRAAKAADTKENTNLPDPESGDEIGNNGDDNDSISLSVSSHGSAQLTKSRPSSATKVKAADLDPAAPLRDALKLLSCVPNHRPLKELSTIYNWLLFSRSITAHFPTSSSERPTLLTTPSTGAIKPSNSSIEIKKRSKDLLRFTKSILFEFSEVLNSTKTFFEHYHQVCSDRGPSTLKEEPQRERILMDNMHCWHTEVGQRISEEQYESLCRSVKSTLSISRSFIYSQISVLNGNKDPGPLMLGNSSAGEDVGPISKQINAAAAGKGIAPETTYDDLSFGFRPTVSSSSTAGETGDDRTIATRSESPRTTTVSAGADKRSKRPPSTPSRPISAGSIRRIGRNQSPAPAPPPSGERRSIRRPSSAGVLSISKRPLKAESNESVEESINNKVDPPNPQYSSRVANSVLTRMHIGRFVYWNAASSVLCEKDDDRIVSLTRRQLKEFARHQIITDDSLAIPHDHIFGQEVSNDDDKKETDGDRNPGGKVADLTQSLGSEDPASGASNRSVVSASQGQPQHEQPVDNELLFHKFAPSIDWKQQFLLETSLFSDVCHSLLVRLLIIRLCCLSRLFL